MKYTVIVSEKAAKMLRKLPRDEIKRISQKIDKLAEQPRPVGAEKLSGEENIYRIRSGVYRIIYNIEDKTVHVFVLNIDHRKQVYRGL